MARHTDPDVDSESRFADVDRMRVHYRRTGTGTLVLFVHGSGSSSHGVEAVARLLSTSYDVIRPDLPGFGVTGPRPDGDYRVQTYAVTIAGFLDAIDVPRCVVVGNSLGGNIAWNLAVDDPDRVDALVLINATGYPEKSLPAAMAAAKNPDVAAARRASKAVLDRISWDLVPQHRADAPDRRTSPAAGGSRLGCRRDHRVPTRPTECGRRRFVKYFIDAAEDRRLDATTRATLRGDFIELSDGITHHELTGPDHGDIIVLTGGITVPLFYWDATVTALHNNGFRTLTYSAYGRGFSDRVHAAYDADLFVRQLRELIEALGLTAPHHLVGASMGALVTMEYIRRSRDTPVTLALGRRIFDSHQGRNVSDPRLADTLSSMVGDAYRYEGSLYAFFQTLQNFPLFDRSELYREIGSLDVPAPLLWGTDDLVTPIDALDEVRGLLRPDELHVVDDCGHMVPFERPALVADRLASFIDSHSDRLTQ